MGKQNFIDREIHDYDKYERDNSKLQQVVNKRKYNNKTPEGLSE